MEHALFNKYNITFSLQPRRFGLLSANIWVSWKVQVWFKEMSKSSCPVRTKTRSWHRWNGKQRQGSVLFIASVQGSIYLWICWRSDRSPRSEKSTSRSRDQKEGQLHHCHQRVLSSAKSEKSNYCWSGRDRQHWKIFEPLMLPKLDHASRKVRQLFGPTFSTVCSKRYSSFSRTLFWLLWLIRTIQRCFAECSKAQSYPLSLPVR